MTGGMLTIDDDGAVHWFGDNDPITVKLDGGGSGVIHTYTTGAKNPDAVIVNPFVEGLTMSVDHKWFYQVTSVIYAKTLTRLIKSLLEVAAAGTDDGVDPVLIPYLKVLAEANDRTVAEFEYISTTGEDGFCSISYNKTNKQTRLFLGLEDPTGDYQKQFNPKKVSKKTWAILNNLLHVIFSTDGSIADAYSSTTNTMVCPRFRTFLVVWEKVWSTLKPILSTMEMYQDSMEFIDEVAMHADRIDVYHNMCKWTTQMAAAKSTSGKVKPVSGSNVQKSNRWDNISEPEATPAPFAPTTHTVPQPGSRFNNPVIGQMPMPTQAPILAVAPGVVPGSRFNGPNQVPCPAIPQPGGYYSDVPGMGGAMMAPNQFIQKPGSFPTVTTVVAPQPYPTMAAPQPYPYY